MAPETVVFDVNETLSDLRPLTDRFTELGAPEHLSTLWFASTLREGIALAAAGDYRPFAEVARETAQDLLAPYTSDEEAPDHVIRGFLALPLHPDVVEGVRRLRAAGSRLVTLSNGAASVAERLLGEAGIRDEFEYVLSVDDAGIWKPAPGAYEFAARVCRREPGELLMVAVHPWDLHGAARAGLRTAWIDRDGRRYPEHVQAPDHRVPSVGALAELPG
ncbi:haloacid dehalogenase type II [Pseudonocardia yuanmonensis]|uniref:Haloacid dehalogenase type II n=1 Tax=Pseudonocardia yuanmonensis TaxID=1095914 RepID=A0ABP8XD88_9PSEU